MSPVVFDFESYKTYLRAWLRAQPKEGHGFRRRMSLAIGTQTGFVTQVLSGPAHFSAEQIVALKDVLGLSVDEQSFLLLLLQKERAGTKNYRDHVDGQIAKVREDRKKLSVRLKATEFPSDVDQNLYFSSWIYSAIHVMITIRDYQNSALKMAEALKIPLTQVNEVLEFLVRTGLVQTTPKGYQTGTARVHLGTDSPYLRRHHTNWNLQALQDILTQRLDQDLHYSSVVSLSKDDVPKVREIFTRALEDAKAIVRDSEGEKLYATTLNFFAVTKT